MVIWRKNKNGIDEGGGEFSLGEEKMLEEKKGVMERTNM